MRVHSKIVNACLAFGLMSGTGWADEACQSPAEFTAHLETHAAESLSVERIADITGPAAQPIVDLYNQTPPPGDVQADEVLVFHALSRLTGQEHPQWVVALFFKGCKQEAAMVPSSAFRALVGSGV